LEKGGGRQVVVKPAFCDDGSGSVASPGRLSGTTRLHNFVEIVREKEYSFSKYLLARLLSTAGRGERGSRGFRLV
jgi:hypothetical protein